MNIVMSNRANGWEDLIHCPHDVFPLRWVQTGRAAKAGEIPDGRFECVRCNSRFPVYDGIARFIVEKLDDDRKEAEMRTRDKRAEYYDQYAAARGAMEIDPCLNTMQPSPGDTVLELGCGTGRLTLAYILNVRRIVAVDFSLASLMILRDKIPDTLRRKILLVHADICAPPVARAIFSKVVSFQVLEHLPTPEMRKAIFGTISTLLKPEGSLTCSVYNWSWQKQRDARRGVGDNTQKEGTHSTGIHYYNFEASELREMIQGVGMKVESMGGIMVSFPGARFLSGLAVPLSQLVSRTPLGTKLAHLLLCRAHLIHGDGETDG